ncbi:MAG: hypothetical protein ACK41D_05035 [Rubricoccaceae bacterium]
MSLRAARLLASAQLRADLRLGRAGRSGVSKLALTALAYGFSGAVLAASLGAAAPERALFVAGSFALVLAAFGVVGSYDELMGRPRENAWLTTLPATERTHYAARLAGVAVYLALMGVGVGGPVAALMAWHHGPAEGLLVGGLVAVAVVWTASLALAAVWLLTLHLPGRALRLTLALARGLLVGLLVLGYQWIGMQPEGAVASGSASWWPAAWLADARAARLTPGLCALGLSAGAMLALFVFYFPTRYFRLLGALGAGPPPGERRAGMTRAERLLVPAGAPRAAYGLAVAAFAADRIVRGRLWPVALLPLGFVALAWLTGGLGSLFVYGPASVLTDPATQLHLSVLIVLVFCVQTLVQTLQHADHAEASWVFGVLPNARPRLLWLGAEQALVWRVLVPVHGLFAAGLLFLMPAADAVLHALFWLAVSVSVARARAMLAAAPPFSQRPDRFSASAHVVPLLLSVPIGALALLVQYAAFGSPARAALVIALAFGACAAAGALVSAQAPAHRASANAGQPETHPATHPAP